MTDNLETKSKWPGRLDDLSVYTAAMVPVGIVIGNTGFEIAIGLAGLFWLVRCAITGSNPLAAFIADSQTKAWLFWYLVIIVSLLWNGPGSKGIAHDVIFFRQLLFLAALLDVSRRRSVAPQLLYGLGAGILFAVFNTSLSLLVGSDIFGRSPARYLGKLKEASRIAGLCAYAAPFFFCWAFDDKGGDRRRRRMVFCLGLLATLLLMQIHIRTAILAALVGLIFALINVKRFSWSKTVALAVIVLVFMGGLFCVVPVEELYSMYDRVHIWKVSWNVWLDNPFLGSGVSSFQNVFSQTASSGGDFDVMAIDGTVFNGFEATHAHNLFLMLMAATGLAGLAAFLWLYVVSIRKIFSCRVSWRGGLVTWPAVVFVLALFGYNIYHSWYQALFVFMVALIGTSVVKQKTVNRE